MDFSASIDQQPNGQSLLRIVKRDSSRSLFRWSGETARRVIAWSGIRDGEALCKNRVRDLAVVGAAVEQSVSSERRCLLDNVIKARRGEHLSEDELVSLCHAESPGLGDDAIRRQLDRLVSDGRVQRISIDRKTFYDADTSAHLHVYDPVTATLHDAPCGGVIVGHPAPCHQHPSD